MLSQSISRRALFLTGFGLLLMGRPRRTPAQRRQINLYELLTKDLKARRPEEFRFAQRVVVLVEAETLPLELVLTTYQWARKDKRFKDRPFPYFEQALRRRARKEGIVI
jgi:hypothetical protein